MIQENELFLVGQTQKPHGTRGEIVCNFSDLSFDDENVPFLILKIDCTFVPFYFESYRFKTDTNIIAKFENVDNEEETRLLVGKSIYLPLRYYRERTPEEMTLQDMVGFTIIDVNMGQLGTIVQVDESTLNTLFYLTNDRMIPANDDFVENIDYQKRILKVSLPEGILEI